MKTVGAAGLGSVLVSANIKAEPNVPAKPQETKLPQVPRRTLGKTGVNIPVLSLGAFSDLRENQVFLANCAKRGVTYWDTSYGYAGGNSEAGIGKFLAKNPDLRKGLFIVTKAAGAKDLQDMESHIRASLKRMNTDYLDLFLFMELSGDISYGAYGISKPEQLVSNLAKWVEDAKKRKLIRFFGFSTHSNMADCMVAGAKLDYIDVIMPLYNFRVMQDAKMKDAVQACFEKGIGLVAMKVLSLGTQIETDEDKKLVDHFLKSGFTPEQAKIKAVLEDERISSVAVGMKNVTTLTENVAAVLGKTKLSQVDKDALQQYADATCTGYCAGCSNICNAALPETPYVRDIMRHLMYYNSYGEKNMAKELFAQIPTDMRSRLLSIDYALAEARCPQHLPIAKLVAEAVSKLA